MCGGGGSGEILYQKSCVKPYFIQKGIGLNTVLSNAVTRVYTVVSTEFLELNSTNYRFSMLKITKNSQIWQLHQRGVNYLNTLVVLQFYL